MNQSFIKVSIALTTYNHQDYIEKCLDSILMQEVDFNFEIVIGEDKSKDNTREIIEKYQSKYPNIIKILDRPVNIGYTRNFDDTMQQCNGEYVAIFDGDDYMLPGKLKKQVDFLEKNKDYVMVGHVVKAFISQNNNVIREIKPSKPKPFYTIKDLAISGSFFANSSKMFRKAAYPKEGINPKIKFIADWAITMDIVRKDRIGFIWENLAMYRVHGTSIMQSLKPKDDFKDKVTIINSVNLKYNNEFKHDFSNQWAYSYLILGQYFIENKKLGLARKCLFKSLRFNFFYSFSQHYNLLKTFIS